MSLVMGVFGMIGSGKSTVARRIQEKYGYLYIDCDSLGHTILEEQKTKDQLLQLFGNTIFTKDGFIDRKNLSQVVFADWGQMSQLEAILWPIMTIKIVKQIKPERDTIIEAAVLFSAGWNLLCHYTIYIDVPGDKREEYLRKRNVSKRQITQILKSQQEIENQSSLATFTIHNTGTYQELLQKVDDVMSLIQKRRMKEDQPK